VWGGVCTPQSRQSARLSLQSSELGPLTPYHASERSNPNTRQRVREWADQIRTRGQTLWYFRFTLCWNFRTIYGGEEPSRNILGLSYRPDRDGICKLLRSPEYVILDDFWSLYPRYTWGRAGVFLFLCIFHILEKSAETWCNCSLCRPELV
jgi:hypothetical protein